MTIQPIKTAIYRPEMNLVDFIVAHRETLPNRSILAITSKIISLSEGRLVSPSLMEKDALVKREADVYLGKIAYGYALTIKDGHLIPSAGIDESNSESGDYILYPENSFASAHRLWSALRARWRIRDLGILITDSHTTALRRGVTGFALAHWGFGALRNLVGSVDLFGRELQVTQMNLADGLAAGAVLMMGEGNEACPLALLDGAPVEFREDIDPKECEIPLEEDLFYPILAPLMK